MRTDAGEPWRAAWREAKKRPAKHRTVISGIATGHVQLEDIEMHSVGVSAVGRVAQRPGTPPGRGEDEDAGANVQVDFSPRENDEIPQNRIAAAISSARPACP